MEVRQSQVQLHLMWMHAHGSRLGRQTHRQTLWLTGELMKLTSMDTTFLILTGVAMVPVPTI